MMHISRNCVGWRRVHQHTCS